MSTIISVNHLYKTYDSGHHALKDVSLEINKGEILALLGPNGAGKTTLISTICGIVTPTSGTVTVAGFDTRTEFRKSRELIGLVPQELTLGAFDTVWNTLNFSRGLFGKKPNPGLIEQLLQDLSLDDKKHEQLMNLSGGMKRRVLIAKALVHEPQILFLDEPTAGVDVELRKDMWRMVEELRSTGVTIILTTHYIEEAEEIADRVAVINQGEILLQEDKQALMQKMGTKQLDIELHEQLSEIPASLAQWPLELSDDGCRLTYTYDSQARRTGITSLLQAISASGLSLKDIGQRQSTLEEIFVNLVNMQA